MEFKSLDAGKIALVVQDESGRICQLGMTQAQHLALQTFIASITKDQPLVKMGEEYDLIPKANVKKMKK